MSADEPLLVVEDLSVEFVTRTGTVQAVRSADLKVSAGECLAVVGESGSGKSVTARSLVGLAGPTARVAAARLRFEGRDLLGLPERQWRNLWGGRVGFVFQDALTSLDPLRRVGDEVGEPLEVHGRARGRSRDTLVESLLLDVGIPDPDVRARQYPHELSGGLRQRALIASSIAAGPALLIADEPTTALDVTIQAQILDLLAAKTKTGTAVILISHDLAVVSRLADRIAVMYAGLIVEEGPAEQVLTSPAHPYTVHLLAAAPGQSGTPGSPAGLTGSPNPIGEGRGCPYAARCPAADERCWSALPELSALTTGRLARCWHPGELRPVPPEPDGPAESETGSVIIEAAGISKRFRSPDGSWRQAVDDVSFTLHAGEALGVVGESGSGKTTTAQIVLGMLAPDRGQILLDGSAWSDLKERQRRARRHKIQVVYQDPLSSFDPRFTVDRIIGEALGRPGRRGATVNRHRIVELLRQVGLDESFLARRAMTLSGGQRQRVAIARAIAPNPEVLICDEPVSALDVSIQAQILDLFGQLRAKTGVALLFISHDLAVIRQVCDRVLVMNDGAIVETGQVDTVFAGPQHPYTRALLAALPSVRPSPLAPIFQGVP